MSNLISAPLRQQERISIIDTLRGVALLGILMMNIPYFSNPHQYAFNLNVLNEYSGPNYYTWWVVNGLFEGTMRGLFSLLFGAGCLLLLSRLEKKETGVNAADIYYRRLLWLFLFGLVNAFILLWPGDILYSYAICGLFLFPFRRMQAKHLFLVALAFMFFSTVKSTYKMYSEKQIRVKGENALSLEKNNVKLTEAQEGDKAQWLAYQDRFVKPESIRKAGQKEIQKIGQQNYFGAFLHLSSISAMIESKKFYHDFFFDIMGFLFLGMALFRWNVLTGKRSASFYWGLLLAGYGLGIPLSYWEHQNVIAIRFDKSLAFDQFMVDVYQLRRVLLVLGHMSVVMLIFKYNLLKWLQNGLARVGQMAFTNYLMQTIICTTIFYGFGFALYGKLERYETYYVVGAVWAFQIIFSNIWLQYYKFGPFEWVWRSLTYWKRQPMRKNNMQDEGGEEEPRVGTEKVIVVAPATS